MLRSWHQNGFTLVELLVVIVIVAVIVGLTFSVLARARATGRQANCLSNERQLVAASLMYADDCDGYMPPYRNQIGKAADGLVCPNGVVCSPTLLFTAINPYVKSSRVWFCPEDPYAGRSADVWSVNHQFSSYTFYFQAYPKLRVDRAHLRYYDVSTGTMSEEWPTSAYELIMDSNEYYGYSCDSRPPIPEPPSGGTHFKGVNTVYLDGHGRWIAPRCP